MSNKVQNPNDKKKYDLEERTAQFGEAIIELAKTFPQDHPVNNPLINQIVRAGTSVGANYMEADGAESKKDFQHKISICKKESKETKHWLRMLVAAVPQLKAQAVPLWKEAKELHLIFAAVHRNTKN